MALVTRRNPETDELESYWDPSIVTETSVSDEAFAKGKELRKYAVARLVTMYDIAKEIGVTSVDVSDTFRGLHEITPEIEAKYRAAIDAINAMD